mmetsp:Transcript_7074/g.26511  ORF Transcript_7074/g.26511 Transcript_7074/m.26511 type:complete len:203 (-) Transcript_7074:462-1070(-)
MDTLFMRHFSSLSPHFCVSVCCHTFNRIPCHPFPLLACSSLLSCHAHLHGCPPGTKIFCSAVQSAKVLHFILRWNQVEFRAECVQFGRVLLSPWIHQRIMSTCPSNDASLHVAHSALRVVICRVSILAAAAAQDLAYVMCTQSRTHSNGAVTHQILRQRILHIVAIVHKIIFRDCSWNHAHFSLLFTATIHKKYTPSLLFSG